MRTITVIGTGRRKPTNNEFRTYDVCTGDGNFPDTRNNGYASYRFTEHVQIVFEKIPARLYRETDSFRWYGAELYIAEPNGDHQRLTYERCERLDGEVVREDYYI